MFTGIIEEAGIVKDLQVKGGLCVLKVQARKVLKGTDIGQSISVNGVCLTVTAIRGRVLWFDMMKETIQRTNLKELRPLQKVNLERSLKWGDRLGGHIVTGHIDGVGRVKNRVSGKKYLELEITLEKKLMRYVIPKGSITIDGVSLTVGRVKAGSFTVYLIPHTLKVTNLLNKKTGEEVNIETDMVAKYVLDKVKSEVRRQKS